LTRSGSGILPLWRPGFLLGCGMKRGEKRRDAASTFRRRRYVDPKWKRHPAALAARISVRARGETRGKAAGRHFHLSPQEADSKVLVLSMGAASYFSQLILISLSSTLNSGSPVTSSAFRSFASAAANASARLILKRALNSAAQSANARLVA